MGHIQRIASFREALKEAERAHCQARSNLAQAVAEVPILELIDELPEDVRPQFIRLFNGREEDPELWLVTGISGKLSLLLEETDHPGAARTGIIIKALPERPFRVLTTRTRERWGGRQWAVSGAIAPDNVSTDQRYVLGMQLPGRRSGAVISRDEVAVIPHFKTAFLELPELEMFYLDPEVFDREFPGLGIKRFH